MYVSNRRRTCSSVMGSRSCQMRMASQSVMRSGVSVAGDRPWSRLSTSRISCMSSLARVIHQEPPPVPTIVTVSPSRGPKRKKSAMAFFARSAFREVRCTWSNTITKERAVIPWRPVLTDTRGRSSAGSTSVVSAETSTASKVPTSCGTPSSSTLKSSARRPARGPPPFAVTTTSTTTSSTSEGNRGASGVRRGSCPAAVAARDTASRTAGFEGLMPAFSLVGRKTGPAPMDRPR